MDLFTIGKIYKRKSQKLCTRYSFHSSRLTKTQISYLTETAAHTCTCSSATISSFKGAQIHDKRIKVYTKEINIHLFTCFES